MAVIAIDQGTTGTTVCLFDCQLTQVKKTYCELTQHYPQAGWVEHDPEEIWQSVIKGLNDFTEEELNSVDAIGITNQRETALAWEGDSGDMLYRAIVWQCRRTAPLLKKLKNHKKEIKQKTGLPLDAYFSASKWQWILEHSNTSVDKIDPKRKIKLGTIDTYLTWRLTQGQSFLTDHTNASRTMVYNIFEKKWDENLLKHFNLNSSWLPKVQSSGGDYGEVQGLTGKLSVLNGKKIRAVLGDQQSALYGQRCFAQGDIKNTYGTGCFVVMQMGEKPVLSDKGLLTTLAADEAGEVAYALEGTIFMGGALVQWLRDELQIISCAAQSEDLANQIIDNLGVYIVPAFTGLGAPHWDMEARGIITGLTRGAGRNALGRAALEAIAYQSHEIFEIMEKESGFNCQQIKVDGGACVNNFLMQFQSDLSNKNIFIPDNIESTSLGVATLAAKMAGIGKDRASDKKGQLLTPQMKDSQRNKLLKGWQQALQQCKAYGHL